MGEYFHSVLPFKICWLLLCFNISYWILLTELDDLDIKKMNLFLSLEKNGYLTLACMSFGSQTKKGKMACLHS